MCQACLEAELWLAYQEELAATQAPTVVATGADGAVPAATADARPDRPQAPFACEESPAT